MTPFPVVRGLYTEPGVDAHGALDGQRGEKVRMRGKRVRREAHIIDHVPLANLLALDIAGAPHQAHLDAQS